MSLSVRFVSRSFEIPSGITIGTDLVDEPAVLVCRGGVTSVFFLRCGATAQCRQTDFVPFTHAWQR